MALRALLRASRAQCPLASLATRSIRAVQCSSLPPRDVTAALISVRNAAATYGHLDLLLPLPGSQGLTRFEVTETNATVHDVIAAVKHADPTLRTVELATPEGTKVARTVRLRELLAMSFCLQLNDVRVMVERGVAAMEDKRARDESVAFATVKAELAKDARLVMPVAEFYQMCQHAGAEEKVALKWLRELQRRNLVVHFDRSRNAQLEKALILRPYSLESVLTLQNALDSELYNIKHDRKVKERQLAELKVAMKNLQQVEASVALAARRMPNVQKWVGLSSLTGFYGALMYCVWDVYSWDVMEPITYFIGFTAVLSSSFYHAITKKDPTYSNIWQKRYADRVAKLSKQRKYDPAELEKLQACVADLENDITLLSQWEKVEVAPAA